MEKIDIVIVGAEGVVETGGIVNSIGTHQIANLAKANSKPFYVAAESYKFARMYPLNQSELPKVDIDLPLFKDEKMPNDVNLQAPCSDYTAPENINLLFTDLGVLTPSAVSDELIKLYQ